MFGNNGLRHLALSFLPGWNETPSEQRLDNGFAVSMETFPLGIIPLPNYMGILRVHLFGKVQEQSI